MKLFLTVFLFLIGKFAHSQYLSLDELLKFQKSTDFTIEKMLTAKNWSLDNTQPITIPSVFGGDDGTIELKQISYAYNRNTFNSKSQIWLSVRRRDEEDADENNDEPKCRIYYQLHDTIDYSKILKRATELGFKPYKSWTTENNEYIKFLMNDKLDVSLQIISKKITEDGENINVYQFNIISRSDYMLNYSE